MAKKRPPAADTVSEQVTNFLGSVEDYGMSLNQLAELSELDCSNLSKAARGKRLLSRNEIDAICSAMGWELK